MNKTKALKANIVCIEESIHKYFIHLLNLHKSSKDYKYIDSLITKLYAENSFNKGA